MMTTQGSIAFAVLLVWSAGVELQHVKMQTSVPSIYQYSCASQLNCGLISWWLLVFTAGSAAAVAAVAAAAAQNPSRTPSIKPMLMLSGGGSFAHFSAGYWPLY